MIKIGILGKIGSGKSYISKMFGCPVFNADEEVIKIYKTEEIRPGITVCRYTEKNRPTSRFVSVHSPTQLIIISCYCFIH